MPNLIQPIPGLSPAVPSVFDQMYDFFSQATIDHSTEGSMRVHQIVTFRPPKGCGCDALLEADYYPYSMCHLPGTAGKILPEGTKVRIVPEVKCDKQTLFCSVAQAADVTD